MRSRLNREVDGVPAPVVADAPAKIASQKTNSIENIAALLGPGLHAGQLGAAQYLEICFIQRGCFRSDFGEFRGAVDAVGVGGGAEEIHPKGLELGLQLGVGEGARHVEGLGVAIGAAPRGLVATIVDMEVAGHPCRGG